MDNRWTAICLCFVLLAGTMYLKLYSNLAVYPIRAGKLQDNKNTLHEYPSLTKQQQEELEFALKRASTKRKFILRWYQKKPLNIKEWPTELCGNCELTSNQSMINHPDTAAVVFLYKNITSDNLPQGPRRSDQLHVWYTGEAPSSLYSMRHLFLAVETRYQFNLTQTYRRDSGIYHPYGDMEDILDSKLMQRRKHKDLRYVLKTKTKVAVAVVSNCNATGGAKFRLELIEKMKELGLEIDTFGRCFDDKINETRHEFEGFLTKYKFYLAFENAFHCRDYITEKFYINGYRAGTVPVALGAPKDDYLAVAPEDSFIFVEDFESVASLVNFLNHLDKNDEEYLTYFNWIERGLDSLPMKGRIGRFCQLCRQIHGINVDDIYHPQYNATTSHHLFTDYIVKRNVPDLRKWYYHTENKYCYEKVPDRIKRVINFSDLPLTRDQEP